MGAILSYLFTPFTDPLMLVAVAAGTCAGVYVGAIPGLTGTMAVSLLVSLTFGWNTHVALAAMIGVFCGAVYGGSRSAILLNIPGAPAAVATVFDGYPLAQKGKAGMAIGITTTQSVVGGIIGVLVLAIFTPAVSKLSVSFGPMDYFLLSVMGLLMIGTLGNTSMVKGLLPAALGILIGRVGQDSISGVARFTFGNTYLLAGVSSVVAMIGLYGVSESFAQLKTRNFPVVKQDVKKVVPAFGTVKKYLKLTVKSSLIGSVIGALPGAGGSVAALLTYDQAKRTTKNPEVPFGEGAIEGLVAPESANNAAVGGAFIPMLTLGVPGDAVTAVIMGALTIHGLRPGPLMMAEQPDLFYIIVSLLLLSNVFLLVFGLTGIRLFAKFVEIPKGRLIPIIIILSVTGAFAINHMLYDIFWMIGFGLLGYVLKKYGYPVSPMVLGIILGNLIETNFRRALVSFRGVGGCIRSIFTRPITLILFLIIVYAIVSQTRWYKKAIQSFREKRAKK
ncbi:tripartite tricarboxylate transporter permease [Cuneatibacter sp. NSJ-177]|uniref:tripartite tricarboxylate transporter permease n=1 Tax=Cuneatibacter sp. NSJ-177 TaxID=2931401 RepID=UPI001FCFE209|nr:tripartite tricarboxylate transporter permease [Cuneatibacter sp. NSJ-177]MCJ7836882.1 tripartite tricarboxylate transporter permease [Cuneatibacter sp. NSJ-177]